MNYIYCFGLYRKNSFFLWKEMKNSLIIFIILNSKVLKIFRRINGVYLSFALHQRAKEFILKKIIIKIFKQNKSA